MSGQLPSPSNNVLRRFRATGIAALTLAYLVILAGGIVRMTGSGMGCPDWPMCFGQWIPPTEASQLPADYQEQYAVQGNAAAQFNAFKTWTEYLNRLVGALAGLGTLAFAVAGLPMLRRPAYRKSSLLAIASLVLIMVVAWLGAKVVSTHLAGYMITIHMMLALVLIMTIIAGIFSTYEPPAKLQVRNPGWLRGVALLGFLLVLMQIGLGTQLREAVDQVSNHLSATDRSNWLAETGIIFKVHRSFSWTVLLAGTGFWALLYYKGIRSGPLFRAASLQVGLLLVAFSLGVILAKLALPAPAQPLHLWVASLLAGAQFVVVWGSFRWLGGANDTAADPASTESGYLPNPQASTPEQAQAQPEPQKTK